MMNHDPASVHAACIVIDGHADTAQRFVDEGWDFAADLAGGMLGLDAAKQGGLDAQFFAIWAEPSEWKGRLAFRTLQLIGGLLEQVRRHSLSMRLGTSAADIVQAHADGMFCALLGVEGGHSIENDLSVLRAYFALGVRYMTLTWTNTNEWADSSGDLDDENVHHHGGLTDFGRSVVREMNQLGMMVDVSHVSDATFWDVLRTTRAPILASHSSARALADSTRNLTDEQLQAMATNNGLVMVNFYPSFLDDGWRVAWKAAEKERKPLYEAAGRRYREQGQPLPYSVSMQVDRDFYANEFSRRQELPDFGVVIDHLDHIARVAGINHVGLGSDFDGFALPARGMETAAMLPAITAGLMERGYTAEQVCKILGGNLLRVMRDVESEASKQ